MGDDSNTRGVYQPAYKPAYEAITPCNDGHFQVFDSLVRLFGDAGGRLDIEKIQGYLTDIVGRYEQYNDQSSPNYNRAENEETLEDKNLALQILQRLKDGKAAGSKRIEELKTDLGYQTLFQFRVMTEIREDETFFRQEIRAPFSTESKVFAEFKSRLEKYNLSPCNVDTFEESIGSTYYARVKRLFAVAAQRGVNDGNAEEAIKFATHIINYKKDGVLYGISSRFEPVMTNPNRVSNVTEHARTEEFQSTFGFWLISGLEEYLKADVEGSHMAGEAFTNVYREAPIKLNIPTSIEMVEGEELVFDNVITPMNDTLEYTVEFGREYGDNRTGDYDEQRVRCGGWGWCDAVIPVNAVEVDYDKEKNRLTIKTNKRWVDHKDTYFNVEFKVRVNNLERRAFENDFEFRATGVVRNKDEAPGLEVLAPDYLVEGREFCIDTKTSDREGDQIKLEVVSATEPGVVVRENNGKNQICGQLELKGKARKPLEFTVAASSIVPNNSVEAASAKETRKIDVLQHVFVGEDVILPKEVGKIENVKMVAAPQVGDKYIYIFLRTPQPLDKYEYEIKASEVVIRVNAVGCDAQAPGRKWSRFEKVSNEDGMYLYVSRSPLEPYIKVAEYDFKNGRAYPPKIIITSKDERAKTYVGIAGKIEVKNPEIPMAFSMGKPKRISDSTVRLEFEVKNPKTGDVSLKLGETIPVHVGISSTETNARFKLNGDFLAKKASDEEGSTKYFIDIPYSKRLATAESVIELRLALNDNRGKQISVSSSQTLEERNARSIFEGAHMTLPEYPMPSPWANVIVKGDKELLGYLQKGSFLFEGAYASTPPKAYDPELSGDGSSLIVPVWTGIYKAFWGEAEFAVFADENDRENSKWTVALKLSAVEEIKSGTVTYPNAPEMFANRKNNEGEERRVRSDPAEVSPEVKATYNEFYDTITKGSRIVASAGELRPGSEFYLDVVVPNYPGKFELQDLTYVKNEYVALKIEDSLGNTHIVKPKKIEKKGKDTIRYFFNAPSMLSGKIADPWFTFNQVFATYRVHYLESNGEKFSAVKRIPPFGVSYRTVQVKINFVTDPNKEIKGKGSL